MLIAVSRDGTTILGTSDKVACRCEIQSFNGRNPDGTLDFDFSGDSEMFWDSSTTEQSETGRDLFLDISGDEWPENEIALVDIDESAIPDWGEAIDWQGDDILVDVMDDKGAFIIEAKPLREVLGDDPDEYTALRVAIANDTLNHSTLFGGGAAPLVRIFRARNAGEFPEGDA